MHIVEVKFKGLPKQKDFVRAQDPECLYSGGVGGGKSLALCLKLVTRAAHPQAREFLGRLTLDDLKATTLKTLLEGDGSCPPVLPLGSYMHFKSERTIQLKGGGQIVYGGMDDRSSDPSRMKAGSRNLSGIAVDQAEELTADIYAKWSFRPRAVGEGLTRQVYLACNPAAPSHFLARRFGITGDERADGTFFILTNPMENPYLPADYIARLKTFTGVLYKRMVLGLWVASEGVVYDRWDRDTHVQSRNGPWARVWLGIDDGVTNPFAALRVCEDSDGRLHVEREVYRRGMAEQEKIGACKDMMPWEAALPDPAAAGLKSALRRAGHTVVKAENDVLSGINEVMSRLLPGVDGRPRLTVDPTCSNLVTEMEAYEWVSGRAKDTPQKANDHACLVGGTMVETDSGPKEISRIWGGDRVLTRKGYRRVLASFMTTTAPIFRLTMSNGQHLDGTANHPIWVEGFGWKPIDALRYGDILCAWQTDEASGSARRSNGADIFGTVTQRRGGGPTASTSNDPGTNSPWSTSTEPSGSATTAPSPRGTTSTTRTTTRPTTPSRTLNASQDESICSSMGSGDGESAPTRCGPTSSEPASPRPTSAGESPQPPRNTWSESASCQCSQESQSRGSARSAERPSTASPDGQETDSAPSTARQRPVGDQASMTRCAPASCALESSWSTATASRSAAPVFVEAVRSLGRSEPVYNLEVEGEPEFFANGILAHNCDALRYVCMHRREQAAAAFDANTLRRLRSQCCPALYLGDMKNRIEFGTEMDVKIKNHEGAVVRFEEGDGAWRLWCDLDDTGRCSNEWPYVVAASVGSGLPGNPTVVKVGNAELKTVVAEAVLEGVAPEQAARIVMLAGLWFEGPSGRAKLIWSTSGPGVPFGETIRRMAYGRCYVMHEEGIAKPESSWAGWDWSRDGIQAIFGGWRNSLAADRYVEKSVLTADDCQRWIFNSGGVLAPATLDAEGQRAQDPSDRAMSGMLLSHAMEFYKPSDRPTHKPQPFSIDWLLEREKRQKQQASRWAFVRSRGGKPDEVQ